MNDDIKIGDTVYINIPGQSGWPVKLLDIVDARGPNGPIKQGVYPDINGLISKKYGCRISRMAMSRITKIPNLRGRQPPKENDDVL